MSDPLNGEPDLVQRLLTTPIPQHLWHYTNFHALLGIIETKKIFATDLRYLNDRQEFIHAKELAEKLTREIADSFDTGMSLREFELPPRVSPGQTRSFSVEFSGRHIVPPQPGL